MTLQDNVVSSKPTLVVRYSLLCDDTSDNPKDVWRVAELVFSLVSLKLYLLPYVQADLIIYTLPSYELRISQILSQLGFQDYSLIFLDNPDDIAFADSIKNCTPVDRICIRRMLADFRELPSDRFRLLMGNDCYFFSPPQEVIEYVWSNKPPYQVLYMIDNLTFGLGQRYHLRYYRPKILPGLLGDFYCLAPDVSLTRSAITSCLKLIDDWPAKKRWKPNVPKALQPVTHGCEQQAASMLLGQFTGKALPTALYSHELPQRECVLLHAHYPWFGRYFTAMPKELTESVKQAWSILGYDEMVKIAEKVELSKGKYIPELSRLKNLLIKWTA